MDRPSPALALTYGIPYENIIAYWLRCRPQHDHHTVRHHDYVGGATGIDVDLENADRVLVASRLRSLWYVTSPLALPA